MSKRTISTFAAAGVLALGVGACGSESDEGSSGSGNAQADTQQQQTPEPVAQVKNLSGEQTEVALDPGFVKALEQLKLTPGPVGDATIEQGTAAFPITGGNVTYYEPGTVSPFVQGKVNHKGGLSLDSGDTKVELTDFRIDPGKSVLTGDVSANGKQAASDAPLFFLDGSTLKPLESKGNKAILEGTTVELKAESAALLNKTFGTDALKEGTKVGTATITLNTQ